MSILLHECYLHFYPYFTMQGFPTGSVRNFSMTSPYDLGKLKMIKLWLPNTVGRHTWKVDSIKILDSISNTRWDLLLHIYYTVFVP